METNETPTAPDTPAEPAPDAPGPNKKLAYALVGGIVGFMVIALGVHLAQTNPAPASAAIGGGSGGTRADYGQQDALLGALSGSDSSFNVTLRCQIGGNVIVTTEGHGKPVVTQWVNLPSSILAGPAGLYVTVATASGETWQLGQKINASVTSDQFSYTFSNARNFPETHSLPGRAVFSSIAGWTTPPRVKAVVTNGSNDLYTCN